MRVAVGACRSHRMGVASRDIKLENILLADKSPRPIVKLAGELARRCGCGALGQAGVRSCCCSRRPQPAPPRRAAPMVRACPAGGGRGVLFTRCLCLHADFGLSAECVERGYALHEGALGTPNYFAPELLAGTKGTLYDAKVRRLGAGSSQALWRGSACKAAP